MKIAIGADHAGYEMKQWLAEKLHKDGHEVQDLGAHDTTPSDYPDVAQAVGRAVVSKSAERGLLICGSGVGASIAANKINGILAAVCHDTYSAHQGVEHDDMNVLCLGARIIGPSLALELTRAFLHARFTGEERHVRRVKKTLAIERERK